MHPNIDNLLVITCLAGMGWMFIREEQKRWRYTVAGAYIPFWSSKQVSAYALSACNWSLYKMLLTLYLTALRCQTSLKIAEYYSTKFMGYDFTTIYLFSTEVSKNFI